MAQPSKNPAYNQLMAQIMFAAATVFATAAVALASSFGDAYGKEPLFSLLLEKFISLICLGIGALLLGTWKHFDGQAAYAEFRGRWDYPAIEQKFGGFLFRVVIWISLIYGGTSFFIGGCLLNAPFRWLFDYSIECDSKIQGMTFFNQIGYLNEISRCESALGRNQFESMPLLEALAKCRLDGRKI